MRLARSDEGRMRRVDLSEELLLTASGITRLLDGLEAAGYVDRAACASDRRVVYAVITDAGRDKLEEACGVTLRRGPGAVRGALRRRRAQTAGRPARAAAGRRERCRRRLHRRLSPEAPFPGVADRSVNIGLVIDQLLVEPGTEARLRERSTDATFGLDKDSRQEAARRPARASRRVPTTALCRRHAKPAARAAGDRRVRKGWRHPLGLQGPEPAGLPGGLLQGTDHHGARARLPLAGACGAADEGRARRSSTARTTRTSSPFGSRASRPRPSGGDGRAMSASGSGCSRTRERRS